MAKGRNGAGRASKIAPQNVVTSSASGADESERKRKRGCEDDEVVFICKRHKREVSFHSSEVESNLKSAADYANEGNRSLMEFHLGVATKHAQDAGSMNGSIQSRIMTIRNQLKGERAFHLSEVESNLTSAADYANEGNRSLMEFHLSAATKHAQEAGGSMNGSIQFRMTTIRNQLKGERAFHLSEVESNLTSAADYANEGNRSLMEYHISAATKHAQDAGGSILNGSIQSRILTIRNRLKGERAFHLGEVESNLKSAAEYANRGNRSLMEYHLGAATKHAKAGASYGSQLDDNISYRIANIQSRLNNGSSSSLFNLAKKEPPPRVVTNATAIRRNTSPRTQQSACAPRSGGRRRLANGKSAASAKAASLARL